jgi:hypothetical protein
MYIYIYVYVAHNLKKIKMRRQHRREKSPKNIRKIKPVQTQLIYIYISDIASDHHTDDDGNRAIGVSS